jgi:hypothetical protein
MFGAGTVRSRLLLQQLLMDRWSGWGVESTASQGLATVRLALHPATQEPRERCFVRLALHPATQDPRECRFLRLALHPATQIRRGLAPPMA